jgi:hypothetical protein
MFWPDSMDFTGQRQLSLGRSKSRREQAWIGRTGVPFRAGLTPDIRRTHDVADEDAAERGGWNVEECREAIEPPALTRPISVGLGSGIEKKFENNALYYSYTKSKVIKVAHLYVKEYDGRTCLTMFLTA